MVLIRWAVLCKDVLHNIDGSANLLGVVAEFNSESVPIVLMEMAVALGLQVYQTGSCHLAVRVLYSQTGELVRESDPQENHLKVTRTDAGSNYH